MQRAGGKIAAALLTCFVLTSACKPEVSLLPNASDGGSHNGWEFVEILGLSKWGPTLNFHDNPSLNGDPIMVLDSGGLFYRGQRLCTWPEGRYDKDRSYQMVLTNCPPTSPFTSTFGGGGSGDAKLVLAVFARQGNNIAETTFNGQVLFGFIGSDGVNWRPARP